MGSGAEVASRQALDTLDVPSSAAPTRGLLLPLRRRLGIAVPLLRGVQGGMVDAGAAEHSAVRQAALLRRYRPAALLLTAPLMRRRDAPKPTLVKHSQ